MLETPYSTDNLVESAKDSSVGTAEESQPTESDRKQLQSENRDYFGKPPLQALGICVT